jgi:hypothetical protein
MRLERIGINTEEQHYDLSGVDFDIDLGYIRGDVNFYFYKTRRNSLICSRRHVPEDSQMFAACFTFVYM